MRKILILSGMFLSFCTVFGQSTAGATLSSADDALKKLKDGYLIVRIYMNKPKSDMLKKTINDPQTDAEEKKALSRMLSEHEEDRKKYKAKVIRSFNQHYNYSKLLFIHDYDQKNLKRGESRGIFLNSKGEPDASLMLDSSFYLLCGQGMNENAYVILNESGTAMPAGFPDRYNRNVFQGLFSLFKEDKLADYVIKFNDKLHKSYRRIFNL
ncbi:MAG: hypothetical protein IPN29_21335 [Saprospiraceae bacterium]|nr:hypothetical protein [Saprospiraceae bacterium]